MRNNCRVSVVIPALNEEEAIAKVLDAIPSWVNEVIVVDNGSTDRTSAISEAHGARVVSETRRGYGAACLAGIAALQETDVVVFLDGHFSDQPDEMRGLVDPIVDGKADLVIGSRTRGRCERGALSPQARFGNFLACALVRCLWSVRYTDLRPFRAIRSESRRFPGGFAV
jgi:glycosyltransferase involved in cell wall biosynthesis